MIWRRTGFAFAITLVSVLAVFTLPRFVWNSVHAEPAQTVAPAPQRDSAAAVSEVPLRRARSRAA